jgi:hypothetical protein
MTTVATVLASTGVACLAVGASTVLAPRRVRGLSQAVFPGTPDDDRQWRAVGLLTAGVGLLLLGSAVDSL